MCRRLCAELATLTATVASATWHTVTAAPLPSPPHVEARPVLEDRYPRSVVDFGQVEGFLDLVYSSPAGFRSLHLDLYRRKSVAVTSPLVVFVHGGGWESGHTRHAGAFADWPAVLASLAARGFVVASVEYRLSGEASFPAALHDVMEALRWLRANAGSYRIERERTVIWGVSAGAQLAALVAMSCGEAMPTGVNTDAGACVQGLVAWYGVFDMASALAERSGTGSTSRAVSRYLGCVPEGCDRVAVTRASPVAHVDEHDPPTLLIHGEQDEVVPATQSRRFHELLRAQRVTSTLTLLPGVGHSFIGANVETTRVASLRALEQSFDFITTTIGTQP
ncbi:MAG: alpha/beta hydrolase [Steroidobacteraceae bacterium]